MIVYIHIYLVYILANGSGGFGPRSVGEKNPSVFFLGYPAGFGFHGILGPLVIKSQKAPYRTLLG